MIQSVQHLLLLRQNTSLNLLWGLLLHILLLSQHIIRLLNHILPHLWLLLHSIRRSHLICGISEAVSRLFKSGTKLHLLLVAWGRQLRRLLLKGSGLSKPSIHLRLLLISCLIKIHRLLLLMLLLLLTMLLLLLLDQLILGVRGHPHRLPPLQRIHICRVCQLILLEMLLLLNLLLLRMSLSKCVQWSRRLGLLK